MKRGNELVAHLEPAGVCPVGERAPKEANRMGTAHYLLALAGLALAVGGGRVEQVDAERAGPFS